jgi:predicted MFS family arabinose efflux permease
MRLQMARLRPHNPMPESPYEVLALFTVAMIGSSLSVMSTGALMPFLRSSLHLDQPQLGALLSVQLIGSVAMTSLAGALTDRFGDRAVVRWSGVLMGLALIAASLVQDFAWLATWLCVYGIGYAAVTPAGCHAIIFFFKKSDRGLATGIRQCGVPIAGVLGSLLLPAIALHYEYRAAFAVAGVFTLVACLAAAQLYREPQELQGQRISLHAMVAEMISIARESRLILLTLTSMILMCGQFALMGFLTLTLVHAAGYPLSVALGLFTLSQVGAICGRLSWGALSDYLFRGSRALPLAVVCVLVALLAWAFASIGAGTPSWLGALLAFGLGFTAEGWLGLSVIGFAEIGGEEHSGSALGVGLTGTLLAAVATPLLFGALVEVYGYGAAWGWLALLQALGVVPALLASRACPERDSNPHGVATTGT